MVEATRTWHKYDSEYEALHTELAIVRPRPQLPRRLYHYTTAEGVIGIVHDGVVNATELRYMNDTTELSYASELLDDLMEEQRARYSENGAVVAFIERYMAVRPVLFEGFIDVYAFCLSEHGDELGMWRAYGQQGAGYAIGYELWEQNVGLPEEMFVDGGVRASMRTYSLLKVTYDRGEQRRLLGNCVARTCEVVAQISAGMVVAEVERQIVPRALGFLEAEVAEYVLGFKSMGFQGEAEWRAVHLNLPIQRDRVEHRGGRLGVTPFVKLNLQKDDQDVERPRIVEVVQGCRVDRRLDQRTLLGFLEKHGYAHVSIRSSELPLRF